ncbi:M6 family metalloprotease domain-containing protein [Candidatus Neomarinimicrobiota bacterium]
MKTRRVITFILLLASISGTFIQASIPPHPRVREMIARGEIAQPYFLRQFDEIRARGVNAPWSAPSLSNQLRVEGISPARTLGAAVPPNGDYKALFILVDFSDNVRQTDSTFFDTLAFHQDAGTLWDYYQDASYGTLDIVTLDLPSALGWVRAPQTYAYYVNADNGFGSYPQNAQGLAEDVVNAVNSNVDFSQYDNDGDGYVDALFIVHSGPGAEYTGSDYDIWSHAWATVTDLDMGDGYGGIVRNYSMEPEYWSVPGDMTIGVYAHEMGHAVFGLPDLYDYGIGGTGTDSRGLGRWSLMAGGSWNGNDGDSPALPDAWSHFQMGYVNPMDKLTNEIGYVVAPVADSAEVHRIWINGIPGDEYFLVENRQQLGYDTALPGEGLLIYHIDEALQGAAYANDNEWHPDSVDNGHYLVALEQADGLWNLERDENSGDTGDPYPGSTANNGFNYSSTPNSQTYAGDNTEISIINITPSSDFMIADFMVDQPQIAVSPDSLYASLVVGDTSAHTLTLDNSAGSSDLVWQIALKNKGDEPITFTKDDYADPTDPVNQDRITDNVWITRANSQGIYNAASESLYNASESPEGTEWSFGNTADLEPADYQVWVYAVGWVPPDMVGAPMSVHLTADDLYIDILFHSWTSGGYGGGFSYTRTAVAPSWLKVSSATGSVPAGGTEDINVTIMTDGILAGVYDADILISSNDPVNPQVRVPVHLELTGIPNIVVSKDTLDFGSAFVGYPTSDTLVISNNGTDVLSVTDISADLTAYSASPTAFDLAPGDSQSVGIVFEPTTTGSFPATLTITSNDTTKTVAVLGEAIEPPVIAVTPDHFVADQVPGDTSIQVLSIDNSAGGSDLTWQSYILNADTAVVVAVSPVFEGLEGPEAPKASGGISEEPNGIREIYRSSAVLPQLESKPSTAPNASDIPLKNVYQPGLDDVLTDLDANVQPVIDAIPNRYAFTDGVTGDYIYDGGGDMYDSGNYLSTDLGGYIAYSDGIIAASSYLGAGGSYFTRKYDGLFVFAADVDGISHFEISGGLGADGGGSADGSVLAMSKGGTTYYGFVKRVYNAGDPSINHLVIVPDNSNASHEFDTYTNNDYHRVTGLTGTDRFYYLLYAGTSGAYIDDAATLAVMDAFLEALDISPPWISLSTSEGTIASGANEDVDVVISPAGIISGDFYAQIVVASNDPVNPLVMVPAELHFTGAPEIAAVPDTVDFGTLYIGDTTSLQINVKNDGTDLLSVTDISTTLGEYFISPTSFDLAPGESQLVTIKFAPLSVGDFDASLTILNNDATTTVAILGDATTPPVIGVLPGQIADNLFAGTMSEPHLITVENTGGYELEYSIVLEEPPALVESIESIPSVSNWLSVNPTSGVVASGETDTLVAVFDAYTLYAGEYAALIVISSNDPLTPESFVAAQLNVTGEPRIAVLPADTVVFDSVFANASTVRSMVVTNMGTDILEVLDMVPSSPVFAIDTSSYVVEPGTSRLVELTFTPPEIATYHDSVTITSNDTTVVVQLIGVGTPPPVIAVNPDTLWDALFVGDTSDTYDLIIDNTAGGAELTYQISAENAANAEETAATVSYRPFTAADNMPQMADQNSTQEVRSGDESGTFSQSVINSSLAMTSDRVPGTGSIQVAVVQGSFWTANLYDHLLGIPDISVDLISSYTLETLQNYDVVIHYGNSFIDYAILNTYVEGGGGLIATPWVLWFGEMDALPATGGTADSYSTPLDVTVTNPLEPLIQNVDFVNGDLVGYEGAVYLKEGAQCGVYWADGSPVASHWQYGEGYAVYLDLHYITSDCAIAIQHAWGQQLIENAVRMAAGYSMVPWIRLSEHTGSIAPGDQDTVGVYFDARNIFGGSYDANILVANNDPLNPEVRVGTHLDVTGYPGIALEPDTLEFDPLYIGDTDSLMLLVANDGTDLLTISGFSAPNPAFTLGVPLPFSVSPDDSILVPVRYSPTAVGTDTARITLSSNATDKPTTTFFAMGSGTEPPEMVLSAESFSASLAVGDSSTQVLTIGNRGLSTLEFQISFKDTSQEVTSEPSRVELLGEIKEQASISPSTPKFAYVCDSYNGAVLVIDTETNEVVEEVPVGDFPHRLEFNADGSEVWVSDYYYRTVSVINTTTNTVDHEIQLGSSPFDLAFSPDGRFAYVTSRAYAVDSPEAVKPEELLALPTDGLYIVDAKTYTVMDSIAGISGAKDVAVSPDGRFGYLLTHGGTVFIIDLDNYAVVDTVTGASGGHTMKLSRDGKRVYFSEGHYSSPNAMRYIDLATNTLSVQLGDFNGSVGFDFSPDGTLLYALDGWDELVVIISTVTGEVVGSIPNDNLGEAFGLAISRDGRFGYVSSPWSDDGNSLFIFDTETESFIAASVPDRDLRDIAVFHGGAVTWIKADPTFATVPPQSSLDVAVLFDASTVEGGSYDAHMVVSSNDPQNPEIWLPVHLDAEGVPNIAVEPDTLDFGTVYANWPTILQLAVINKGSDLLDIAGITPDNAAYLVDPASFQLLPRESRLVEIALLADGAGAYDAILTVASNDPDEPEVLVTLTGEAIEPPVMAVDPGEFSATLEPGDSTEFDIEIRNQGGTELNVQLRKGSGGTIETLEQRHLANLIVNDSRTIPSTVIQSDYSSSRDGIRTDGASIAVSQLPTATDDLVETPWTSAAPMNEARAQHGLAALPDGRLYAFGGYAGGSPFSSMEVYDPSMNTWAYAAPMPSTERGHSFTAGLDGRIYSFAWYTLNSYAYEPSTNTWTTVSSPLSGNVWEGGATLGSDGLIYLMGGEDRAGSVQIYNPVGDSWTTGASMPTARQQLGVIAGPGGFIYAIGGRSADDNYLQGVVEVFDPRTNSWSVATPMPTPRNQFAVCLGPDDRIYTIGGKDNYGNNEGPFFDVVEIYDPYTDTWETGPPLPVPLGEMEATVLDGKLYVVGGTNGYFTADVFVLDVESAKWLTLSGDSYAIPPSGSVTVTAKLNSTDLAMGRYSASVVMNSNDPGMSAYNLLVDMILSPLGPPQVTGVMDVPNDQGGKATVTWHASEDDAGGSAAPIAFYRVWLRAPEGYVNPMVPLASSGQITLSSAPNIMLADGWATFLDSIPAQQAAEYMTTIPTFADSNHTGMSWTSVSVSAHVAEDSVFYALSGAGRGYSVDNLAPTAPSGIVATVADSVIQVEWTWTALEGDGDFWHYRLFRGEGPLFTPGPEDEPLVITENLSYTDADVVDRTFYYYRAAAVDTNGNVALGGVSAGVTLDVLANLGIPDQYSLHQNYPNPFNPTTTLKFEVPVAGRVQLTIYDLLGREVNRLVDSSLEPGYFEIRWDGRNGNGVPLATGLYFARMAAPGFVKTVKMIMMK